MLAEVPVEADAKTGWDMQGILSQEVPVRELERGAEEVGRAGKDEREVTGGW